MVVHTAMEVEAGRVVVRRTAAGADAEGLQARAHALVTAAGPGVLAVVRSGPVDGGWELVTEHGGLPAAAHRLGTAAAVGTLGAAVAEVLARLHEEGLAHGSLELEHVLVGPDGRPTLDGLAPTGAPADDVAALAAVLLRLVDGLPSTAERRERGARTRLQVLLSDVGRATAGPGSSAGRLGAALRAGVGGGIPPSRSGFGRRVGLAATASVLVALVLAGLFALRSQRPPPPVAPTDERASTSTTVGSADAAAELPPCAVAEGTSPPTCPHRVAVDGATVTVDRHRAEVGRPGDQVLVADWGCDGTPRAAVLRPATGEVLVFGPIAADGGLVVVLAERVEGATALSADLDDQGCAILLVLAGDATLRLT